MKNRIILLLGYWLLAFFVVWVFGAHGEGSFLPVFVFSSWPGLVIRVINLLLNPEARLMAGGLLIDLSLIVLYYICLMRLVSKLVSMPNKTLGFIPGVIHLCGGLAFFLNLSQERSLVDWRWKTSLYIMSIIVSLGLTLLWLLVDWYLAMGDRLKTEPSTKRR